MDELVEKCVQVLLLKKIRIIDALVSNMRIKFDIKKQKTNFLGTERWLSR